MLVTVCTYALVCMCLSVRLSVCVHACACGCVSVCVGVYASVHVAYSRFHTELFTGWYLTHTTYYSPSNIVSSTDEGLPQWTLYVLAVLPATVLVVLTLGIIVIILACRQQRCHNKVSSCTVEIVITQICGVRTGWTYLD